LYLINGFDVTSFNSYLDFKIGQYSFRITTIGIYASFPAMKVSISKSTFRVTGITLLMKVSGVNLTRVNVFHQL